MPRWFRIVRQLGRHRDTSARVSRAYRVSQKTGRRETSVFFQTLLALFSLPVVRNAQTIRAVLLDTATDTTRAAFFSSRFAAHC